MELLKALHHETLQLFPDCIRSSSVACIVLYSLSGIAILLSTVYLWLWPFQYAKLHFRNLPGGSPPFLQSPAAFALTCLKKVRLRIAGSGGHPHPHQVSP